MVCSHCQTPTQTEITIEPVVVCIGVCVSVGVWQCEHTINQASLLVHAIFYAASKFSCSTILYAFSYPLQVFRRMCVGGQYYSFPFPLFMLFYKISPCRSKIPSPEKVWFRN